MIFIYLIIHRPLRSTFFPYTTLFRSRVKELYPSIFIVVLTLHRDFEYIQKAMRLGAIDYIAKVELDSEDMDRTLDRIHKSILNNEKVTTIPQTILGTDIISGVILISDTSIEGVVRDLQDKISPESHWIYLGLEAVLFVANDTSKVSELKQLLYNRQHSALLLIDIENNKSWQLNDIKEFIQGYKNNLYFYEVRKDIKITSVHMKDVILLKPCESQDEIGYLKIQLKSLEWIFNDKTLENMLKKLRKLRLERHKVNELLIITLTECQRIFSVVMPNTL